MKLKLILRIFFLGEDMSYKIEWRDNCVLIKYIGDLNIVDLFKLSGLIIGDSRYDSLNYVISDFLKVTSLNLSKEDIKEMSTLHVIPSIWNPNLKFSIVSNNSDIQEMVIRYIDLMKSNEWKIKLFDNFEESLEWCNNNENM